MLVDNYIVKRVQSECEILCDAAFEYARIASDNFVKEWPHWSDSERKMAREKTMEEMQIHYLFPNLQDSERYALLALKFANKSVCLLVNSPQEALSDDQKQAREIKTTEVEKLYLEARSHVLDSGLMEKLSDLQADIVQDRYVEITFSSEFV